MTTLELIDKARQRATSWEDCGVNIDANLYRELANTLEIIYSDISHSCWNCIHYNRTTNFCCSTDVCRNISGENTNWHWRGDTE